MAIADREPAVPAADEGFLMIGPGLLHYRLSLNAPGSAAPGSTTAGSAAPGSTTAGVAPLVFLHEGLGSMGLWRSFPADLRAATGSPTSLVYSRHGYGRSMVLSGPRTPDYMHREALEILPAVLDSCGIEAPVLIGHSDGASIALLFAGSGLPVKALVLIAPHVFVEECTIEAIEGARQAFATTDLAARLGRHHDDPISTFRGWNDVWLSDEFRTWNITSALSGINAPVLIVQGADDAYGTTAQLDAIEQAVNGLCERVVIPGVGHAPHLERPDECRADVARFVRRIAGGFDEPQDATAQR